MTKAERKEAYKSIQNEMLKGNNKRAFEMLSTMCGKDTGLFLLCDYDKMIEIQNAKVIIQ